LIDFSKSKQTFSWHEKILFLGSQAPAHKLQNEVCGSMQILNIFTQCLIACLSVFADEGISLSIIFHVGNTFSELGLGRSMYIIGKYCIHVQVESCMAGGVPYSIWHRLGWDRLYIADIHVQVSRVRQEVGSLYVG
jgi:hypothetical protein